METLLTFVIVLGVPLWLAAEELVHRFGEKDSGLKAVEPTIAASPATPDPRRALETSSHVA
jgi:hypothetical protein